MLIGKVISINVSKEKGKKKKPTNYACIDSSGIKGDAHGGDWHRQVSLLSFESIEGVNRKGITANPGDFAENLTVCGIDFKKIKIGDAIVIGKNTKKNGKVILKVTQIGKECHTPCKIYYLMGSCIMPEEGIFCRVLKTGKIKVGDLLLVR